MQKPGRRQRQVADVYDTYISFYLSGGRLHIQPEALRKIGCPPYVRFLLNEDGKSMIMEPYNRKVFASMRVPKGLYGKSEKRSRMEVKCAPFCRLMAHHLGWEESKTYRIQGKIYANQCIVKYDLQTAYAIKNECEERLS